MYGYIPDKQLRTNLREYCEDAIYALQNELKECFTFSFKLIGSGDTRLMMVNGNDKSIDLDYNLVIQRDKKQLSGDPSQIKHLFMASLKKILGKGISIFLTHIASNHLCRVKYFNTFTSKSAVSVF